MESFDDKKLSGFSFEIGIKTIGSAMEYILMVGAETKDKANILREKYYNKLLPLCHLKKCAIIIPTMDNSFNIYNSKYIERILITQIKENYELFTKDYFINSENLLSEIKWRDN